MTMDTRAHIADPVNPEKLFLHLLDILEADPAFTPAWERPDDGSPFRPDPGPIQRGRATYEHTRKGEMVYQKRTGEPLWEQSESEYQTTLGQGLAAILEVKYAEDGPLIWPPHYDDDLYDDDYLDARSEPLREHLVSVSFDTAYGYQDANGAHCGDLHAYLLTEVRNYLDSQPSPVTWLWHHEEEGVWYRPDQIEHRGDPRKPVIANLRTTA